MKPSRADEGHRPGGAGPIVRGVYHLGGVQLLVQVPGQSQDLLPASYQNGTDQSVPSGGEDRLKGVLVVSGRHHSCLGREVVKAGL